MTQTDPIVNAGQASTPYNTVTNSYDNFGDLLTTQDALGHSTGYSYNPDGTVATTTNANNGLTQYCHHAFKTEPLSGVKN